MENNGLTRRIDELGRIVIPKEIRKNLQIRNNDELEINVQNNKIILSKYNILENKQMTKIIIETLSKYTKNNILLTTKNSIVESNIKNNEKSINIDDEIINIIENREERIINKNNICIIIIPLLINGDIIGSIIMYNDELKENDINIVRFCSNILKNYLE